MNKKFYGRLGKMKIKEPSKDFIRLMECIGFSEDDEVEDVCDWHIEKLS